MQFYWDDKIFVGRQIVRQQNVSLRLSIFSHVFIIILVSSLKHSLSLRTVI